MSADLAKDIPKLQPNAEMGGARVS